MSKKSRKWLKAFSQFLENLRIDSKHIAAVSAEAGIKLDLWDSQQRVLDCIGNGLDDGVHVFYILKSRQLGVSTVTLAILLFWLAIHPRIFGALAIDNERNSENFRNIIVRYMDSFPAGYFGKSFTIIHNNAKFLEFSNGSRLDFLVAGKSKTTWGESRAYTVALLSEVSKYGRAEGLNSFIETLSETNPDRLYIFESTAHGPNHWKAMWEDAGVDVFMKRRIFVGWWSSEVNMIPTSDPRFKIFGTGNPSPNEVEKIEAVKEQYDYKVTKNQLAWYRWRESNKATTREMLDESQPWTEDDAFVLSGMSFFQVRKVTEDLERAVKKTTSQWYRYYFGNSFMASKCEQILDPDRRMEVDLRIWEQPVPGGRYAIGFDPAYGRNDNADNNVICVARCFADKWVQVAEYASNAHTASQAAWAMAHLAGMYQNCIVNLEIGGPGDQVVMEINSLRQQLRSEQYQRATGAPPGATNFLETMRWYLYHRPDSMGAGYVYHWQTSIRTKFRLIGGFRDSHVTDQIQINSVFCLREMYDVTQEGAEVSAPAGLHDDRVFAAALADECWKSWIRPSMIAQGLTYDREMKATDHVQSRVSDILNTSVMRALNAPKPEPPINVFLKERGLS
jgi:hypothetical protein